MLHYLSEQTHNKIMWEVDTGNAKFLLCWALATLATTRHIENCQMEGFNLSSTKTGIVSFWDLHTFCVATRKWTGLNGTKPGAVDVAGRLWGESIRVSEFANLLISVNQESSNCEPAKDDNKKNVQILTPPTAHSLQILISSNKSKEEIINSIHVPIISGNLAVNGIYVVV